MYLSIIILPLLGSIVSGFMGRKVGISGSQIITCTCLILSSFLMSIAFYEVGICGSPVYINLGSWIDSELLFLSWEFYFDQLTVSLGLAVLYCSSLIHIYSVSYMSEDPHPQRFMSYLSAFTAGMLVLICGGNYFVMFIGWESIGVVSYLLINFYFTRIQANKASILAFTMNRVGDMGMSIGFFGLFALFGSLNYATIFSLSPFMNETALTIIALLLLMGAMAKSANIPFHSWLPGSMEAPTPVSALLHAATLVTAGIYLLLRSSPILEYSPTALLVITLIGSSTAFFAGTCGLVQNDLKRIIAFSTISQLGYMVMAIGLSQYNVALMHTVNHAFFKALLFLGAGAVIHSFADQQDVRKMGGLIKFLPFTYSVMLVGSLSLLAIPFLTGFYSKDLILELAYGRYSFSGMYAYVLGSVTAGITAFYSFRLISLVFFTYPNGPKQNYLNSHESNLSIIIPLFILALFSILFGFVFSDLFVGIGSDFFGNSLFIHPNNISLVEAEFSLSLPVKLLPAILSVIGAALAIFMYHKTPYFIINLTDNSLGKKIYGFLNGKYYFDVVYNHYIVSNGLLLGYKISKEIDRGVIELLGPHGLTQNLISTGKNISKLDTGIVTTYSLYITLGLLFILFLVFAPILADTSLFNEIRIAIIYFATLFLILTPKPYNSSNLTESTQQKRTGRKGKEGPEGGRDSISGQGSCINVLKKWKIFNIIKNLNFLKKLFLNNNIFSRLLSSFILILFFIFSLFLTVHFMMYIEKNNIVPEHFKLEILNCLFNIIIQILHLICISYEFIFNQPIKFNHMLTENCTLNNYCSDSNSLTDPSNISNIIDEEIKPYNLLMCEQGEEIPAPHAPEGSYSIDSTSITHPSPSTAEGASTAEANSNKLDLSNKTNGLNSKKYFFSSILDFFRKEPDPYAKKAADPELINKFSCEASAKSEPVIDTLGDDIITHPTFSSSKKPVKEVFLGIVDREVSASTPQNPVPPYPWKVSTSNPLKRSEPLPYSTVFPINISKPQPKDPDPVGLNRELE